MNKAFEISRRRFIVGTSVAGAGLSLGVLPRLAAAEAGHEDEVNAWVVVSPDDTVTVRIARSEMGQGTLTGLAQLVAEELQCDWDKVTWEFPTPGENLSRERVWGDFSTGGSRGLRGSQQYVREGGAAARIMLIEAAADLWGVPASECYAEKGVIRHRGSSRQTTYGKVADAASQRTPPAEVTLKDESEWTVAGQPVKRLDTKDKLTGKLVYGADIQLDGMLLPGRGGQAQELRRVQGRERARRAQGDESGNRQRHQWRGGGGEHLVAGPLGAEETAGRVGLRSQRGFQ